jgi:hypothetical protein
MAYTRTLFAAAALLAALSARATAQRAATDYRLGNGALVGGHQTAIAPLRSTLGQPNAPTAIAGPTRLRVAGTVPVRVSWSKSEVALASAFAVALLIDAGQTRGLARNDWRGFRETNPFLGARPTVGQINTYTAVSGLAVLGVAAGLPARVRPWFLGAALALEAFTIAGTVRQGIPITLP